ncbi:MAG: AmmeMemoRadiSam system protein B, partial [Candidatus Wallbacteria bacterium]|nr:AmmeMemoRadiSam system protein B [Candidatus Wallbacteria bacterium]
GTFYPSEKAVLDRLVSGMLESASVPDIPQADRIFGLIAPHAGYPYSGPVAACSYKLLMGRSVKTVVVIGPSHYVSFAGCSIFPEGVWESPLGRTRIDTETAGRIMKDCPFVTFQRQAFGREHALETQLPFLQKVLGEFAVVPVVTGSMGPDEHGKLASCLANLARENSNLLIVASTDMSHYHDYDKAKQMDEKTLEMIAGIQRKKLLQGLLGREFELCGMSAVLVLLETAEKLFGSARVIKYANSGDTAGERSKVVGYASVAFTVPEVLIGGYTAGERSELIALAARSLVEFVKKGNVIYPARLSGRIAEKNGIFVTLYKDGQLRGCIGYAKGIKPLAEAVVELTCKAASADPRFSPVQAGELSAISIEISILTPLKLLASTEEIEVGRHGLMVTKGLSSGLLLPGVALDSKWDRVAFLENACIKAGLKPDDWRDQGVEIYTFETVIVSGQALEPGN